MTSTTETKAHAPSDCHGIGRVPPSDELSTPMVSLKKNVPIMPEATPEMTIGRSISVRKTFRPGRTEFISTARARPAAMLSGTVNTMNSAVLSS